jgi:hypothetical protein
MLIIRNNADSSRGQALNVVAHLEFTSSDNSSRVLINDGWWCEDDRVLMLPGFYIARSETKHLVITGTTKESCFAIDKQWDRYHQRYFPNNMPILSVGVWRLTIEITAEHARAMFYSNGTIYEDGASNWTDPLTTRPASWDDAP